MNAHQHAESGAAIALDAIRSPRQHHTLALTETIEP